MTASKKSVGSDFAKVDLYTNTPADYEELPELDDAFFDKVTPHIDKVRTRGRPPLNDRPKKLVSLRLDADVLDAFKATGPGWQKRINDMLARGAAELATSTESGSGLTEIR